MFPKSYYMILFCLGLQLLVLQPTITKSDEEAPSLKSLVSDPYILIAAGKIEFLKLLGPNIPKTRTKSD